MDNSPLLILFGATLYYYQRPGISPGFCQLLCYKYLQRCKDFNTGFLHFFFMVTFKEFPPLFCMSCHCPLELHTQSRSGRIFQQAQHPYIRNAIEQHLQFYPICIMLGEQWMITYMDQSLIIDGLQLLHFVSHLVCCFCARFFLSPLIFQLTVRS